MIKDDQTSWQIKIKDLMKHTPTAPKQESKQLPIKALIVLIALLSAFTSMSTDLYLPALPSMSQQLETSIALVNLTLVLFFIFLSLSALIWGPMSDKYGRKRILLLGIVLYLVASVSCALSGNIYQLIIARVFQAIGGGAGVGVQLAIVKDCFPGKQRERAIAVVAILAGAIPMIAPSIGAFIIRWTSWRGSFLALTILGVATFILTIFFKETNTEPSQLSIPKTTLRLFKVLGNPAFTRLVIVFGLVSVPIFSYISVSSYIFIQQFGLSEEVFSLFFGSVALSFAIGGPTYLIVSKFFKPMSIITASYVVCMTAGVALLTIGDWHPVLFALCIAFCAIGVSASRPAANSLLLEQQDGDSGSASSLINSVNTLSGAIGMIVVSIDWGNRITVLGTMCLVIGGGGLILWIYSKKHCRVPPHFISNVIGVNESSPVTSDK